MIRKVMVAAIVLISGATFQNCTQTRFAAPPETRLFTLQNGSGYFGMTSYVVSLSQGYCPDLSNIDSQIDVDLTSGLPSHATLVRHKCQRVPPTELIIGRDVTISSDFSTLSYDGQTLLAPADPIAKQQNNQTTAPGINPTPTPADPPRVQPQSLATWQVVGYGWPYLSTSCKDEKPANLPCDDLEAYCVATGPLIFVDNVLTQSYAFYGCRTVQ